MQKNGLTDYTIICALVVLAFSYVIIGCSPKDGESVASKRRRKSSRIKAQIRW